jgi:hypothetical protein
VRFTWLLNRGLNHTKKFRRIWIQSGGFRGEKKNLILSKAKRDAVVLQKAH